VSFVLVISFCEILHFLNSVFVTSLLVLHLNFFLIFSFFFFLESLLAAGHLLEGQELEG
jgi:hypothetical protein